ncbi:MAG TPA: hypothetical protein PKA55_00445 [Rhodoblastus sp.]|nr:hypothetical protein [Rhodoblastus sp.]
MSKRPKDDSPGQGSGDIPHLALTHGHALWLLGELGLRGDVALSTFNSYIKSLRKLGIPFANDGRRADRRRHVVYDFEALMELSVALLLRVYGTLPDEIAAGLRDFRDDLRPIYRQAYLDTLGGLRPPARISTPGGARFLIGGLFLDLNVRYAAGRMLDFGPPRAISPFDAIRVYALSEGAARSYLPLNVTAVARKIVERSRVLPPMRRTHGAHAPIRPRYGR